MKVVGRRGRRGEGGREKGLRLNGGREERRRKEGRKR